ncbi:MAG: phenylalanine 4-monooxygenase [Pseudomonadota bacterium]
MEIQTTTAASDTGLFEYVAKQADAMGWIDYSDEENSVWSLLYQRQLDVLEGRACDAFMDALSTLDLPRGRIPQCAEISETLRPLTGWSVTPVPAIIPAQDFFELLASKRFPAASFIRRRQDLDYLEEPDIFHEVFGHTPHLTDDRFAQFTHAYGKAGLAASDADRELLARLYWFTVEFGLVRSADGVRAYGAGICSSPGETRFAVEDQRPERRSFDVLDVLRTPFRIDTYQDIYYVIEDFDQLFELAYSDLSALLRQAKRLGDFTPSWHQGD